MFTANGKRQIQVENFSTTYFCVEVCRSNKRQ